MKAEEFVRKYYQLPESKIQSVRIKSLIKCLESFEQHFQSPQISEEEINELIENIWFTSVDNSLGIQGVESRLLMTQKGFENAAKRLLSRLPHE